MNTRERLRPAWRSRIIGLALAVSGFTAVAMPAQAADTDLYGPVAGNATKGGTMTFGSLVEPPALDPFHQAADARIRFTVLVYQGLFYEAPSGDPLPLLAKGFEISPDGLVYTIKLRQG